MGSELRDTATNTVLWGAASLNWYVRAWTTGSGLSALCLTSAERDGRYGRAYASRLLRLPAFARVLAGIEPYTDLVGRIMACVVHPDAVLEFPYDWRLPVAHNAELLAERADAHLARWHRRAAVDRSLRHLDGRDPKLVFVAHSMGGLLVAYLATIPGFATKIRTSVTIGTPFHGSVKAAVLLNSGRGAPIPLPAHTPIRAVLRPEADEGLRRLAAGLPAVHDLLPTYRCVDENATNPAKLTRRLTVSDIINIGGDRSLAIDSARLHERLASAQPIRHRAVVGVAQPTAQSLTLTGGLVTPLPYTCLGDADNPVRTDRMGDGTVCRDAATSGEASKHHYLPAQHAGLAKIDESLTAICHILTEGDPDRLGPPMGTGELGIELPDVVDPGQEWKALVTGISHPRQAHCTIHDEQTNTQIAAPRLEQQDGRLVAPTRLQAPGIYRVWITASGYTPVSQLVMVTDPTLAVV
jgi:hypothetical protein